MMTLLKYFLFIVLIFMIYIVISTSLKSNLFTEWDYLMSIPWMQATLWDFYANMLLISLWVVYKERKFWKSILWMILFFLMGSIGTILYILVQIFSLKKEDSFEALLTKRN